MALVQRAPERVVAHSLMTAARLRALSESEFDETTWAWRSLGRRDNRREYTGISIARTDRTRGECINDQRKHELFEHSRNDRPVIALIKAPREEERRCNKRDDAHNQP